MRALGVDVSLSRGLDAVALGGDSQVVWGPAKLDVGELGQAIADSSPDVIAIDSPPEWALVGKARAIERQLQRLGISIFATPADPGDHPFYRWMRVGFEVFAEAAQMGFELYRGVGDKSRRSIEVFPHASAVLLRGSLPPRGTPKQAWRRETLELAGTETTPLKSVDALDAALAALTGLRFLEGRSSSVGTPGEAVLILPIAELPVSRLSPNVTHSAALRDLDQVREVRSERLCACGCGAPVTRTYKPGHDAKHRSALLKLYKAGEAARLELESRGWLD